MKMSLQEFIEGHRRLFVLTGAGCSTNSGLPDYRDEAGQWKRAQPMTYQVFMGDAAARRRYWARSMVGWPVVAQSAPNAAHAALARLEKRGVLSRLVTQNVDGLHGRAGSQDVVELHGNIGHVRCMACGNETLRAALQTTLVADNPSFAGLSALAVADGDAQLEENFSAFRVPPCMQCGGLLKPDVVFFGESVPRARVDAAAQALEQADAMLVLGSSLMVYSGFRFCEWAARSGKPIAAVNLGRTRADALLDLKVEAPCGAALSVLVDELERTG